MPNRNGGYIEEESFLGHYFFDFANLKGYRIRKFKALVSVNSIFLENFV